MPSQTTVFKTLIEAINPATLEGAEIEAYFQAREYMGYADRWEVVTLPAVVYVYYHLEGQEFTLPTNPKLTAFIKYNPTAADLTLAQRVYNELTRKNVLPGNVCKSYLRIDFGIMP